MVAGTWARGHARRGRADAVEPLSDEEIEAAAGWADLGEITIPDEPDGVPDSGSAPGPRSSGAEPPEPDRDEPPAHASKERRKAAKGRGRADLKPVRITAALHADINAKISMPLEIGGQIWAARDRLCGGVFLQQRPAIADSLTAIVLDSPDLIAFFTGPGGKFMRYLEVAAAVWPVLEVAAAHHVWHTMELAPDAAEAGADGQRQAYAA